MKPSGSFIVGRHAELAVVASFLDDCERGPASLRIEGHAGIGKTAIWTEALHLAEARGIRTLQCRCHHAEATWAFAGLGDLLDGLEPAVLAELPHIQRDALSAALLVTDAGDDQVGSRVVGVAVLGTLRAMARVGPVLLAVDDVQWLDRSSRAVLTFALRRLAGEPVRVITSHRSGTVDSLTAELMMDGEQILVGPVTVGSMQRIVRAKLDQTLPRPTLTRLHSATGGNPMMCLEMARALQRRGTEQLGDHTLPVSADLRILVTERLGGLTASTRALLLFASALAQPTAAAIAAAVGDSALSTQGIAEAVSAGVLEVEAERLRFTHPLLASIPYADLTGDARRALHSRLAATVSDPEEHARHAALGSDEPFAEVASALDVAARRARHRGSIDAAAELALLAVGRTPRHDAAALLRRSVEAAGYHFLLGDTLQARSLLDAALDSSPPGPDRVQGLLLQASIDSWENGDATVAARCAQALVEAGDDMLLQALCHATFAETSPSGAGVDLLHCQAAAALLDAMTDPPAALLANVLTNVAIHGLRLGNGLAIPTLECAIVLQATAEPVPVSDRAGLGLGMYLKVVDRFEESRHWLETMQTAAVDEGDDSALPLTLGHLAALECWSGNYSAAVALATEGRECAERMGVRAPMPASVHVLALAHQGHLTQARLLGELDLAADEAATFTSAVALHLRSLGIAALMAGDIPAAADHLVRALRISAEDIGINEPAILRIHPDAVTAMVMLDRRDDAETWAWRLHESALANKFPWATTMESRCYAQLKIADGDIPAALELLEHALAAHQTLPMPFEQAQTKLIFGRALRRSGHRRDARRELADAQAAFRRLGTPIQERQATAELASVGGRRPIENQLTPAEHRIADLVAAGQTNREVAEALFLGVRTVESHLSRIYHKLGLRSRTELAAHRAD